MTEDEVKQRSEFQFSIIKMNLVTSGILVSFALKPPQEFEHTLLIVPVISFALFCLWVNHAVVIRLNNPQYKDLPWSGWQLLNASTFLVHIFMNFVLIPFGAILLYSKDDYSYLKTIDYILLLIITILYACWFYLQYIKKKL